MNSLVGNGFSYQVEITDPDGNVEASVETNLMPQASIDFIASLLRGAGAAPVSGWYLGLFEAPFVPNATTTAADLPNAVGESVAYDSPTRLAWAHEYDGVGFIGNFTNAAEFEINADKTIHGAFIVSQATKGSGSGVLLSIARFSTAKTVSAGSTLRITAGLTLTPTAGL